MRVMGNVSEGPALCQALEGLSLPISCKSDIGELVSQQRHLNYVLYEVGQIFPKVITACVCAGLPTSRADPGGKAGSKEKAGLECDSLAYLKCYLLSSKPIL